MHQQQQDSLKILKTLEKRLCSVILDDESTLQGSDPPSCTSTNELRPIQVMAAPVTTSNANYQIQANTAVMNVFATDASGAFDTSDSEATSIDDESEHLTTEELAKCASHVQKLLQRITQMQDALDNEIPVQKYRKRRVHKMYKRFCHKFEADILFEPTTVPDHSTSPSRISPAPAQPPISPRGSSDQTPCASVVQSQSLQPQRAKSPTVLPPDQQPVVQQQQASAKAPQPSLQANGRLSTSGNDPWRGRHSNDWLFNGFSYRDTARSVHERRKSSRASHGSSGNFKPVKMTSDSSREKSTSVAPSGSSKTEARSGHEVTEKRRKLSRAAHKAVIDASGDTACLKRLEREKPIVVDSDALDNLQAQNMADRHSVSGSSRGDRQDIVDVLLAQWTNLAAA